MHTIMRCEAALSILACSSIIFIYTRFPRMRTWSYTLVVIMVACSIGGNAALFIAIEDPNESQGLCIFQGVIVQFFDLAVSLWSVVIAYSLYTVVVLQQRIQGSFKRNCHVFVWGVSLMMTLVPFTTGSYGSAGMWCWIQAPAGDTQQWAHDAGTIWRILCMFLPIWINIFAIAFFYYRVSSTIANYTRMSVILGAGRPNIQEMEKLSSSLYLFPVVFVAAWSVATASRGYHWAHPEDHNVQLAYLQITLGNGTVTQSIGNALVYNSTRAVHARWQEVFAELKVAVCSASGADEMSKASIGEGAIGSAGNAGKKGLAEPLLNPMA